jgi:hypothetical protein
VLAARCRGRLLDVEANVEVPNPHCSRASAYSSRGGRGRTRGRGPLPGLPWIGVGAELQSSAASAGLHGAGDARRSSSSLSASRPAPPRGEQGRRGKGSG